MKKVFFRVDSGNHIGSGHLVRCLTLAEWFKKNSWDVHFITKNHQGHNAEAIFKYYHYHLIDGGIDRKLSEQELSCYANWLGEDEAVDLEKTNSIIKKIGKADLVIVDSYSLGCIFEEGVSAHYVMAIDDLYNRKHAVDIILNQNIIALKKDYKNLSKKTNFLQLLGPEYALLREEFPEMRNKKEFALLKNPVKKIMVFFGGMDVAGDTAKLLSGLNENILISYQFDIVFNETHSDFHIIKKRSEMYPNIKLHKIGNNFAELMISSDLFIGAGGSTAWERACLGVASAVVCSAENQKDNCLQLNETKTAYYLGKSTDLRPEDWGRFFEDEVPNTNLWNELKKNSYQLVDGKGAERVFRAVRKLIE